MRRFYLALVPALCLAALEACDKKPSAASSADAAAATTAAELDASVAVGTDAGHRIVLKLAAASFVASVSDSPAWPDADGGGTAKRLGYLRNGAIVSAYDPPIKNEECKEGWYELVEGGYVCGKVATIDLSSPRVKLAPKQPDLDAGMPYRYGVNVTDGTPLYRRVLSTEDRKHFEGHAAVKTEETAPGEPEKDEEPALASEDEPPPRRHGKHGKEKEEKKEKDPFRADAGRPLLKELKGHGVLVRKMARGFTIALDREFKAAEQRWWRTTFGFAVPFDRIAVQPGVTKYSGNWFIGDNAVATLLPIAEDDAGATLAGAVAFMTSSAGRKIEITDDVKGPHVPVGTGQPGPKVGWGTELPRRSAVLLTGREKTVSGVTYQETVGGFYVQVVSMKLAHPQIPADVAADEKWIDVDLTRQQLVAFEGRKPVFATLISSGRRNPDDKEHDFPTPPGTFRIHEKHVTTTMDGDVASDGPYSIEDVPWVMYFQGSYALHGAFWHDSFGNMRSHGCVNLAPEDARTLFAWADPPLPNGWHGVFAKDDASGSRVVIHEDPPPKRR